jgi:hypothetical protein
VLAPSLSTEESPLAELKRPQEHPQFQKRLQAEREGFELSQKRTKYMAVAAGAVGGVTALLSLGAVFKYGGKSASKYQVSFEQQSLMVASGICTCLIACGVLAKSYLGYQVS